MIKLEHQTLQLGNVIAEIMLLCGAVVNLIWFRVYFSTIQGEPSPTLKKCSPCGTLEPFFAEAAL